MRESNASEIIAIPELVIEGSRALFARSVRDLVREPAKRAFTVVIIGVLLDDLPKMPNLGKRDAAPLFQVKMRNEIDVLPSVVGRGEADRNPVRRILGPALPVRDGLAPAIVVFPRMAGGRRVVP